MSASSPLERLTECLRGRFDSNADWFELIATANAEFVAPALYRSLAASGAAARAEPDALAYLAELDRANRTRNRRLWRLVSTVTRALNAAGITPVLIKGAGEMALLAEPQDYARMLIDADMLVDPADLPAAVAVLQQLGFEELEDSAYGHSPGSYWRPGEVAALDLHSALPDRIASLLSRADLRQRLTAMERDGLRFRVPDASLGFLINIAHDMLHHTALASGATNLRYLLPLAGQIQDPQSRLDWDWLRSKQRNWRFRLAFGLQLRMLASLLGVTVPAAGPPGLLVRLLHWRRQLKFRNPRLGRMEWEILRRGLKPAQALTRGSVSDT